MTEPTVCAIMLTRDRPELAKRAVECFRKQTYENKTLLVFDSSEFPFSGQIVRGMKEAYARMADYAGQPIGALRNAANTLAQADILIHFDDDDWSHPNRIMEQVAFLQASGADCVGYNEMLFWREQKCNYPVLEGDDPVTAHVKRNAVYGFGGEAWLYTGTRGGVPALGTSLCYWRKTWERHHFANETQGVEDHWMREKVIATTSSIHSPIESEDGSVCQLDPRMIARIHGGNTSNGYDLEKHVAQGSREWKRVPEWDARVREMLK
jgi:glycosyltransferase involved in cell wall biosynthesis